MDHRPAMSADAAAVGSWITIFPMLFSGRNVPEEGIVLETAAQGAIRYIRSRIKGELRTCCFDLCLGTKLLTDKEASAAQLEIEEGSAITIVRPMPTEEQYRQWSNLERKSAGHGADCIMLGKETIKEIGWPCIAQALLQTRVSKVRFTHCGVGDDEAEIIAEAVGANANITELYLNRGEIGLVGAAFLAQALKMNTNLLIMHNADWGPLHWRRL